MGWPDEETLESRSASGDLAPGAASNAALTELFDRGKSDSVTVVNYSIMIWYTPQFRATFPSEEEMNLFIDQIFDETNQGYINSEIPVRAVKHDVKQHPNLTDISDCSDFHCNKRICEEIAIIPSKPLRNKIAGFVTHLMKRIQRGPVRGISIKLQEEERERRDNYVPEVSALEQDIIEVDADTKDLLKLMDLDKLAGLQVTQPVPSGHFGAPKRN